MENSEPKENLSKEAKAGKITWHKPLPEKIPEPTYWPALLAFGVVLIFWGLVSTWLISLAGAIISGVSLAGWIGEMMHERD